MFSKSCQEQLCEGCDCVLETEDERNWGLCDSCYYLDDFVVDNND